MPASRSSTVSAPRPGCAGWRPAATTLAAASIKPPPDLPVISSSASKRCRSWPSFNGRTSKLRPPIAIVSLIALLIDAQRADRAARVGEGAEVEFLDLVIVGLGRQRQLCGGTGVQHQRQAGRHALRRLG